MSPDTTFSLSVLIAIAGCFVGLAGWLHSRDTKISEDAEWKGMVNAKLDMAIGLKSDINDINLKHNNIAERVSKIEEISQVVRNYLEFQNKDRSD